MYRSTLKVIEHILISDAMNEAVQVIAVYHFHMYTFARQLYLIHTHNVTLLLVLVPLVTDRPLQQFGHLYDKQALS